jgi:hypothetical protein
VALYSKSTRLTIENVCQEFYTHIAPRLEPLSAELHIRDYAYPGQVIICVINIPLFVQLI